MIKKSKAGFTIMELALATALLGIVAFKAYDAMSNASKSISEETNKAFVEDQARRVLRQIGFAVMGSNRDSLLPTSAAPLSTGDLTFRVNLGIQDGLVVWSDPEKVAMDRDDLWVYWSKNPEDLEEKRVIWTNLVAPYLEGEIPNGMDDNGNGLIDETGLSFTVEGDSVAIRLTLERIDPSGESLQETVQTTVTCRNLGSAE